jgi:hypothetical protein
LGRTLKITPDCERFVVELQKLLHQLSPSDTAPLPEVFRSGFNPIPEEIAMLKHVNVRLSPVLPTLDLPAIVADGENFGNGLMLASDYFVKGEREGFGTLFACIFIYDAFELRDPDLDLDELEKIDKHIQQSTRLIGTPLQQTICGFHFGWILRDIKSAWMEMSTAKDFHGFIAKQMARLKEEIEFFLATCSILRLLGDYPPPPGKDWPRRAIYMFRGITVGQLQQLAFQVELILACLEGREGARSKLRAGLVSWQIGWFAVPRNVSDVIAGFINTA